MLLFLITFCKKDSFKIQVYNLINHLLTELENNILNQPITNNTLKNLLYFKKIYENKKEYLERNKILSEDKINILSSFINFFYCFIQSLLCLDDENSLIVRSHFEDLKNEFVYFIYKYKDTLFLKEMLSLLVKDDSFVFVTYSLEEF